MRLIVCLFCLIAITACNKDSLPKEWIGQWNGPEGTYLKLEEANGAPVAKIRNLDGEKTFPITMSAGVATFERDGKTETITSGNGQDTGMKWLVDKKTCLVVQTGEGYCRD